MSRDFAEKIGVALLIAGVMGLANLALKAERMEEKIRQLERRMEYYHGSMGGDS